MHCGNPGSTKCTGMPTVSVAGSHGKTNEFFLASGSCQSDSLFYWSFSVAWAILALTGPPSWGSSVSSGVRHLKGHSGLGLSLCCLVHQVLKGHPDRGPCLLLACQALKRQPFMRSFSSLVLKCEEKQAIEMASPLYVIQAVTPASMFAWLSFTSISL